MVTKSNELIELEEALIQCVNNIDSLLEGRKKSTMSTVELKFYDKNLNYWENKKGVLNAKLAAIGEKPIQYEVILRSTKNGALINKTIYNVEKDAIPQLIRIKFLNFTLVSIS